ncbi:unnamed protein product [Blepharisma stoltei]|uniref:Uncharacterized protein n=1 Tax=Blepharisma stoltei TaxID=1481888 RepID=A0AAU9JYX7_9CILI|nr:unnamed protein product [Blepharisma stoltei]
MIKIIWPLKGIINNMDLDNKESLISNNSWANNVLPPPTGIENVVWIPFYQNPFTGELSPVLADKINQKVPELNLNDTLFLSKGGSRDLLWKIEEDEIIRHFVSRGNQSWTFIAKFINNQIYGGNLLRKGKHIRERWINHLNPELKKCEWTKEEDLQLLGLVGKYGTKWSKISREMIGRTENSVKNRWNSLNKKCKDIKESIWCKTSN